MMLFNVLTFHFLLHYGFIYLVELYPSVNAEFSPKILIRSARSLHQPPAGGAGRLMCNIARSLGSTNWEVNILCPQPEEEVPTTELGQNCTYHSFPYSNPKTASERLFGSVRGMNKFRSLIQAEDPDIILDDISHIPYYPAHFFSKNSINSIFMHTAFFNSAWEFNGPIKGSVVNIIDRLLPYMNDPELICASRSTKQRMKQKTRYNDGYILNPCINISEFQYQFDSKSKRLLYLGRLTPRKNVSCLINAWAQIEPKYKNYTLSIAGTGNQEESLKQLAEDLNLENIEFHGYVGKEKKQSLYRESLLFIVPSLMEGYMTTGLEALASGTPVVGSDTYGIRDYINVDSNGFLFETNNEQQLAEILDSALSDPKTLQPLAENGRRLAEKHSFEKFKKKSNKVFENLLRKN